MKAAISFRIWKVKVKFEIALWQSREGKPSHLSGFRYKIKKMETKNQANEQKSSRGGAWP